MPYSSNHFRVLKKNPNSLPDISKQLGNSSLVVTQSYHTNIEANDAGKRVSEIWGRDQ